MSGNPLVATSEAPSGALTNMGSSSNEMDNLNAQTSGTGIFNDVASTITDARAGDWGNLVMDGITDGLDLLGAAMDPLGSLAAAGVGWLIEHISFLKEGLDKLAGNPEAVTAKATTWQNISKQLDESATQYQQAAAKVKPDFQGQGGSAYQTTAAGYVATLKGASAQAKGTSVGMTIAAALVGTERGIIRDMISSFVGELIIKGLAALASSWCTFGGTVAAFIADTVVEGGILAEKISGRIAKVVEQLEKLAQKAGKAKGAIEDAANALRKLGKNAGKLTDKSVDAAVSVESKANKLKQAGADWDKLSRAEKWEKAGEKAEDWKDATGAKLPDNLAKFAEPNRSSLNLSKWQEADGGVPKWNTADTTGVVTEGRRQENEQIDRSHESAESYEKEHAREEGGEGDGEGGNSEGGSESGPR
ncbi:PPE domain-containing protein [Amycolatopsis nivea]